MSLKNEHSNTMILAIFRHADPVRQVLRVYAAGCGHDVFYYNDLFDALSRMPIVDGPRKTVIAARPEMITPDAVAAIESLATPDATHYALWLDRGRGIDPDPWRARPGNLHFVDTIHRFDAALKSIDPAPHTPQKQPHDVPTTPALGAINLSTAPLTEAELQALLGALLGAGL